MAAIQAKCESCGRALQYPDEICARCDRKLYLESLDSAKRGEMRGSTYAKPKGKPKYICPACFKKFPRPIMVPWPPKVPCYKLQGTRPCCPECGVLLKSKYDPLHSRLRRIFPIVIVLKFIFGLPDVASLIIFFIISTALLSWIAVLDYRQYCHEDFYVRDDKL
jgi:hypothetical protein